jgi:hypothetical protein
MISTAVPTKRAFGKALGMRPARRVACNAEAAKVCLQFALPFPLLSRYWCIGNHVREDDGNHRCLCRANDSMLIPYCDVTVAQYKLAALSRIRWHWTLAGWDVQSKCTWLGVVAISPTFLFHSHTITTEFSFA